MNTIHIPGFTLIGISIRSTNENNNQAARDIPALWQKFMGEGVAAKIPQKIDNHICCVYTDYEKDFTKPYTVVLGCRVKSLAEIPEGMTGITIDDASYRKFEAKGNLMQGAVGKAWMDIWKIDLDRDYKADFEVYDERSQDPAHAVVDIFIGVNSVL
ncbi:MAG: GyrI-like domain-containing protein [Chitinophagaceae bacterium]